MKCYREYIFFCGVLLGWLISPIIAQSEELFSTEPTTDVLLDEAELFSSRSAESVTEPIDQVQENASSTPFPDGFDYDNVTITNEIIDFEPDGGNDGTDILPVEFITEGSQNYTDPSEDFDYRYPLSYDYTYGDGSNISTNPAFLSVIPTIFQPLGDNFAWMLRKDNGANNSYDKGENGLLDVASNSNNNSFNELYTYKAPPMPDLMSQSSTEDPTPPINWKLGTVMASPLGTFFGANMRSASGKKARKKQSDVTERTTEPPVRSTKGPNKTVTLKKPKSKGSGKNRSTTRRPRKGSPKPTDAKQFRSLQGKGRSTAEPLPIGRIRTRGRSATTAKPPTIRARKQMKSLRNTRSRQRMKSTKRLRRRPRTRPTKRTRTLATPRMQRKRLERPRDIRFRTQILDYDFWYF